MKKKTTGTSLREKIRAALAAQLVAAQKRGDEATEFQLEVALGK